ncbi:MAG TPA: two-component regulator propeller domain-containing protein [Pyrinomonadaceae bacterium]|jgi:PAS domain S-box-containing protein
MLQGAIKKNPLFFLLSPALCLFIAFSVKAEQLPLKIYTSADGMASSVIHHIARDSQGFLWFCARGGLSRFDGYEFISYRLDEESAPLVHRILESRDGRFYWIATDTALYRVERRIVENVQPSTQSFKSGVRRFNAKKVAKGGFWSLYEFPDGRLIGGSSTGLYLIKNKDADEVTFEEIPFSKTAKSENRTSIVNIAEAKDGSLWMTSHTGLVRMLPDGRALTYEIPGDVSAAVLPYAVRVDLTGRVWATFGSGVFILQPEPVESLTAVPNQTTRLLPINEQKVDAVGSIKMPVNPGEMTKLKFAEEDEITPTQAGRTTAAWVRDFLPTSDGKIWMPTKKSLYVFESENYSRLRDPNDLPGASTRVIEDLQGNLWFGTPSNVIKYTRAGLTTYDQASGLPDPVIHSIQETPDGHLLVAHGLWRVSRLKPEGFESRQLDLHENARSTWTSFPIVQDKTGSLWALETKGIHYFPYKSSFSSLVNQNPQKRGEKYVYRTFIDSQGNIWFGGDASSTSFNEVGLLRFNPNTGEWRDFSNVEGFPKGRRFASFAEDRAGNLWFGFYGSPGIVKFDGNRFTQIKTEDGLPKGAVLALLIDQKDRLWISSTEGGLTRVDNPAAEKLEFIRYTENEGLSSDNVRCLAEDADGNIYAGTVRGITRVNPETGQMKHITTADGLATDFVYAAYRDRHGVMWFGTANGLSKLQPTKEIVPPAPQIFISDLQIAGTNYALSEFGQREIGNIEVSASENNLQINFFSIGEKGSLRYQYKLEGADKDWNAPTEQRNLNFANLAPGAYKILIRAVNQSGATSENPAVVSLRIRPPFWRTREYYAAMVLLIGFGIFSLDRYRRSQTRQVQKALKASRESEIRFRTLAETASDAIVTIDAESNIVFVNPALEKIFGYSTQEMIGEKLTILMPEKFRPMHEAGLNRYLTTNQKKLSWTGIEIPGLDKAGKEFPLEVSFGEFERDGKRYFTGIIRDISDRKRAEEALRRSREERLRELERVRTRIATDLHDDIGSSLTQIAVLSEVARGQAAAFESEPLSKPLERIKSVSKELVEAMSDVVWAINPRKDNLPDLLQRMRRFASDVCAGRGIHFELNGQHTENGFQLGANIRREVFAIFKEAVNNAVKYSECNRAAAEFRIENGWLVLHISDDGRGFDTEHVLSESFSPDKGGNGLINMQRRARELGGECQIISSAKGTIITLKVPLQSESNVYEAPTLKGGENGNGSRL